MSHIRKAWTWIKKYWGIIVGALGIAVGAAIAGTLYRAKNGSLKAAVEVEQSKRNIAVLRARREVLMEQDEKDEVEVTRIDTDLEENRRAIEAVRIAADVPDEEIADEFARLGF